MKNALFVLATLLLLASPAHSGKKKCEGILSKLFSRYDYEVDVVKIRSQFDSPNCWLNAAVSFYENFIYAKTGQKKPLCLTRAYLDWLSGILAFELDLIANREYHIPYHRFGGNVSYGLHIIRNDHFVYEQDFKSRWTGKEHVLLKKIDKLMRKFKREPDPSQVKGIYQIKFRDLLFNQGPDLVQAASPMDLPYKFAYVTASPTNRQLHLSRQKNIEDEIWDRSKVKTHRLDHLISSLGTPPGRKEIELTFKKLNPEEIDRFIIESLEDGIPVPLDIHWEQRFINMSNGIMRSPIELEGRYDFDFDFLDEVRKQYLPLDFQLNPGHAVLIVGVKVKKGRIVRLKIQNSYGQKKGDKGFFHMEAGYLHTFFKGALFGFDNESYIKRYGNPIE